MYGFSEPEFATVVEYASCLGGGRVEGNGEMWGGEVMIARGKRRNGGTKKRKMA